MQEVEVYYNICEATIGMRKHIKDGWRVHTCTMSAYYAGYSHHNNILVVYEK